MTKRLRIILSLDYLSSKASFSGDYFETYYNGYYQTTKLAEYPFNFENNISLFNVNVGIAFKIF